MIWLNLHARSKKRWYSIHIVDKDNNLIDCYSDELTVEELGSTIAAEIQASLAVGLYHSVEVYDGDYWENV